MTVQQDERDVPFREDFYGVLRTVAGDQDKPVHLLGKHPFDLFFHIPRIFVGAGEKGHIPFFLGCGFDMAGDVGEELVGDVGDNHTYGFGGAVAKALCQSVGLIVQLFGDFLDPFSNILVDPVLFLFAVEDK